MLLLLDTAHRVSISNVNPHPVRNWAQHAIWGRETTRTHWITFIDRGLWNKHVRNHARSWKTEFTNRIKQYPTSQAMIGAVRRNQRDIQVWVFTAMVFRCDGGSQTDFSWGNHPDGEKEKESSASSAMAKIPWGRNSWARDFKMQDFAIFPPLNSPTAAVMTISFSSSFALHFKLTNALLFAWKVVRWRIRTLCSVHNSEPSTELAQVLAIVVSLNCLPTPES